MRKSRAARLIELPHNQNHSLDRLAESFGHMVHCVATAILTEAGPEARLIFLQKQLAMIQAELGRDLQ